jgi:hypothetical protein
LVVIASNTVIFFLDEIHKRAPSGIDPKYSRFLYVFLMIVSLPPMLEMGDLINECKGDIFPIGKIVDKETPSSIFNHFSKESASI